MLSMRTCLAVSLIFAIAAGPSPAGELPPPTETVITEKDAFAPSKTTRMW